MPLITTRRRCFVCSKWMEVGETFIFEKMRANGVDRVLPMHPEHDSKFALTKSRLDAVKEEAARNGHGDISLTMEGEIKMAEESILAGLKNEIELAQLWGLRAVNINRLESLIAQHAVQVPGDISDQPGEWQIRGGRVDAIQHDGSEQSAIKIQQWLFDRGGKTRLIHEEGLDQTLLKLDSPREPNLVGKDWWIIKTADDIFYTLPDNDFHVLYVPRETT